MEQGLEEKIGSLLKEAVAGVLFGSADWMERMRKRLLATAPDKNVPARQQLVWRPSPEAVEHAVSTHFGVQDSELRKNGRHHNDARSAAICLIRKLTAIPVTELAELYGPVSAGAFSKVVKRTELRRREERSWNRKLS